METPTKATPLVLRDTRIYQFCETDIGDEFHCLICCPDFKEERKLYKFKI